MDLVPCCLCTFSAGNEMALDIHIRKSHTDVFKGIKEMSNEPLSPTFNSLDLTAASNESSYVEEGGLFTSFDHHSTPISGFMDHGRSEDNQLGSSTVSAASEESPNSFLESTMDLMNTSGGRRGYLHCKQCSFQGHTPYQLRKHKLGTHVSSEEKDRLLLQCKDCSFVGETHYFLKKHRAENHFKPRRSLTGSSPSHQVKEIATDSELGSSMAKDVPFVDESTIQEEKVAMLNSPQNPGSIRHSSKSFKSSGKRPRSKNVSLQNEIDPEDDPSQSKKIKVDQAAPNDQSESRPTTIDVLEPKVEPKVKQIVESIELSNNLCLKKLPKADETFAQILTKLMNLTKVAKVNSKFTKAVNELTNFLKAGVPSNETSPSTNVNPGEEASETDTQEIHDSQLETELALKRKIADLELALDVKSQRIASLQSRLGQIKECEGQLKEAMQNHLSLLLNLK